MFLKRYDFKRVREWGLVNDVISLDLEDRHRKQVRAVEKIQRTVRVELRNQTEA
jgi:hypothetical protein